ncbi:hypothetical protein DFH06DRAFT_989994 [Mycena polygramma]|nr:hypothetical protein DFH06DRAFT_989994 [Mycena polygramma]
MSTATGADKENTDETDLHKAKKRGDGYQRSFYNEKKKLKLSHNRIEVQAARLTEQDADIGQLREQVSDLGAQVEELSAETSFLQAEVSSQKSIRSNLSRTIHALKEKIQRIPGRLEYKERKTRELTEKELSHAGPALQLKEKEVIPDATRDLINDLVANDGVRPDRVVSVMKRIAAKLGVHVNGDASNRSIRRVGKEGGVAAKMQFVDAVAGAKGVTSSSDGTTHKNINLESHRATVIGPDNDKKTFFLGIEMALNHTSETQLEGWEHLIDGMYAVYKTSSRCETAEDARDFWIKVTGWHSDHAEDQKKLFRLAWEKKLNLERERRGEQTITRMAPREWADMLFQISHDAVTAAGGIAAWEALGDEERKARHDAAFTKFVRAIGQAEFDKLTDAEKQNVDLFIWGGCCMHKNMNAFKGAVVAMQEWWAANGHEGPLKMYNRDNGAAAALGQGTGAAKRAEERTTGGAIKVTSLAGAIFRHKDRKRGQQDTLRYFWDHETGFNICFPDTSNTRFQSHAGACEISTVYNELILQFLHYVGENKISRTLNNMELNVRKGTYRSRDMHEFVVVSLANQNWDVPYMEDIRGPLRSEDNLLKLGDLHRKLKLHLEKVVSNPKLITGSDTTYQTATLNGRPWQKPEVVYSALSRITEWDLIYVDELLVAYCKGALVTLARFTTEWAEDGPISKLSPENVERAWLEVTNDGNESELGMLRQASKSAPNMSMAYHNALRMYKANGTSDYLKALTPTDRQIIREQARRDDASGANRAQKHAQIVHMKQVVDKNTEKDAEKQARIARAKDVIAKTNAIESIQDLETAFQKAPRMDGYLPITTLDLQLDWHLANAVTDPADAGKTSASGIPKAKSGVNGRGTRDTRFEYLKTAIRLRAEFLAVVAAPSAPEDVPDVEMPAVAASEADDGMYDSEEEYYRA